MGYAQLLSVLRALPPDRRAEVFDFVEFLARRCGVSLPPEQEDWTDADFARLAMHQALRGVEDDDVAYGPGDIKEPWQ